jgi:hypothetical protein
VDQQLVVGGYTLGALGNYSCTVKCGESSSSVIIGFTQTDLTRTFVHQYESGSSVNEILSIVSKSTGDNDIWAAGRSNIGGFDDLKGAGENDFLIFKPCIGTSLKRGNECVNECGLGRYPASDFCRPCPLVCPSISRHHSFFFLLTFSLSSNLFIGYICSI